MNTEKQYTITTKQAAEMFKIDPESFRQMYAPFLDRRKSKEDARASLYNIEDINEVLSKKRKWTRKN